MHYSRKTIKAVHSIFDLSVGKHIQGAPCNRATPYPPPNVPQRRVFMELGPPKLVTVPILVLRPMHFTACRQLLHALYCILTAATCILLDVGFSSLILAPVVFFYPLLLVFGYALVRPL